MRERDILFWSVPGGCFIQTRLQCPGDHADQKYNDGRDEQHDAENSDAQKHLAVGVSHLGHNQLFHTVSEGGTADGVNSRQGKSSCRLEWGWG